MNTNKRGQATLSPILPALVRDHTPRETGDTVACPRFLVPLLCLWLVLPAANGNAEEIDRLLAAVNGSVITDGDLKLAQNLYALVLFGRTGVDISPQEQLNRVIDLELLRQELENFPVAAADEKRVEQRLEELTQAYAEIGGLSFLLRRLGLQYGELEGYVRLQTSILRFVDLRFRPFVTVSDEEIQSYFTDRLIPKLRQTGAPLPELPEVSANISEILVEEKVNASLDRWVVDMRRHSQIEFFTETGVLP
jgi:hypothetical protein